VGSTGTFVGSGHHSGHQKHQPCSSSFLTKASCQQPSSGRMNSTLSGPLGP